MSLRCQPAVEEIGDGSQFGFRSDWLVLVIEDELCECGFGLLASGTSVWCLDVL